MTVMTVVYPKHSGTFFDHDYYLHKHIPMVKTLMTPDGLQDLRLLRGTATLTGGEPTYELIALLTFEDPETCQAVLTRHGRQILGDIPNFTDMKASLQLCSPVD